MLYLFYVKQKKKNTFRVHWLWSVFVFSRAIIKERGQGIVISAYSQKKSCCICQKWKWIQKYRHRRISSTRRNKISEFIVDETVLQVGPEYIWLWVAIEPENGQILAQNITQERNMLIAERFLSGVVRDYGNHPVSTDGGTWYPQACAFLKMDHHVHSFLAKKREKPH